MDPADFVLEPFTTVERSEVDVTVARAVDVVETFIVEGGEAARQRAGAANEAERSTGAGLRRGDRPGNDEYAVHRFRP